MFLQPVQLMGCCRNARIKICEQRFDHHFFVMPYEMGSFDGVLGQPWLQWFGVRIDYERYFSGVELTMWLDGLKAGAHIKV